MLTSIPDVSFRWRHEIWKRFLQAVETNKGALDNISLIPALTITGPFAKMCTFSVMGHEHVQFDFVAKVHRWGQYRAWINELSRFSNSVLNSAMQLHQLQLARSYRPCILHLLCRKTLVLSAEFGTSYKYLISLLSYKNYCVFYQKLFNDSPIGLKWAIFHTSKLLISGESYQS